MKRSPASGRSGAERILDAFADAVILVSPDDFSILWCNRTARIAFGEDLSGSRCHVILSGRKSSCPHCPVVESVQKKAAADSKGDRGSRCPYALMVFPLLGEEESVESFGIVLAEFEPAEGPSKIDLISTVAHELQTPLTSIKGAVNLLSDQKVGALNSRQQKLVEMAGENVNRVVVTIRNLLDISKLEAGGLELSATPIDIHNPLNQSVEALTLQAGRKSIRLEREYQAEGLLDVLADPHQLERTFVNLIGNAIKFTGEGGRITIRTERLTGEEAADMVPDHSIPDNYPAFVMVSVQDSGIGIPGPELNNIFNKFYQTRVSQDHFSGGTGLGLTIAQELVKAHNGRIWAESRVGEGSTFNVLLPKFRASDVLYHRIDQEIQRARRTEGTFSVVLLGIRSQKDLGKKLGPEGVGVLLNKIELLLRGTVRSDTNIIRIRSEAHELFAILSDAAEDGAKALSRRIKRAFSSSDEGTTMAGKLPKTVIRTATYPADGMTREDLVRKLKILQNGESWRRAGS